jgi:hypothetical protein
MAGEDGSARGLIKGGFVGVPPLTVEEQALVDAYSRDQAKTRALQSVKDSSRFCVTCGYPLCDEVVVCGVCRAKVPVKLENG